MKPTSLKLSAPEINKKEFQFLNSLETYGTDDFIKWTTGFEEDLSKRLHSREVLALNSGTAAIHLGLILLGVTKGDEVICQSLTFSASANPILYQGATPVFVDSERLTWNLCPIALEEAIIDRLAKGKKPKAIIAVHVFGVPYQVDAIHEIAKRYDIPVLEDSAEALGSQYKQKYCGTFGDLGVLSFNLNKIITTTAGGALLLKNKKQKEKALFYATQAKEKAVHYQHSELGYNYRISPLCAGLGQQQLKNLDEKLKIKKEIHDFYRQSFRESSFLEIFTVNAPDYQPNYWLTTLLMNKSVKKNNEGLRQALLLHGIEARPVWKPLHLQPFFVDYPYYGADVAESLFEEGLCLPSGTSLTTAELSAIISVINAYFV